MQLRSDSENTDKNPEWDKSQILISFFDHVWELLTCKQAYVKDFLLQEQNQIGHYSRQCPGYYEYTANNYMWS